MNFLRPRLSFEPAQCDDRVPRFERVKRGCNFQVSLLIFGYILLFVVVDLAIIFGPSYVAVGQSSVDNSIVIPTLSVNTRPGQSTSSLTLPENTQYNRFNVNKYTNGNQEAIKAFLNQPSAKSHLCTSSDPFNSQCRRSNAIAIDLKTNRFIQASKCNAICRPSNLVLQQGFDGVCQCQ